jgi:hypothetical protein
MSATGELAAPAAPPSRASERLRSDPRARERVRALAPTLLLAVWLIWLFDLVNNLATVRQPVAERNGQSVLDLERTLHLAPEHALNVWLAGHAALSHVVVLWYENVHIFVTLAVLAWLWWKRADLLPVLGGTLFLGSLIALVAFWIWPTAPLRMLPGGYADLVSAVNGEPVWRLGATALHSNQLCSLPSLHIAWAVWSSLVVWRLTRLRWARALALAYPLVTTYAVMATANHYLLDALAGAAITFLPYIGLSRLQAARGRGPGATGAPIRALG